MTDLSNDSSFDVIGADFGFEVVGQSSNGLQEQMEIIIVRAYRL